MKIKSLIFIVVILLIIFGIFGILSSGMFEKNPPSLNLGEITYSNLKDPVTLNISDDTGVKQVKVSLINGTKIQNLLSKHFEGKQKEVNLSLSFPEIGTLGGKKEYLLKIEATDCSSANFFTGNTKSIQTRLIIDNRRPDVSVINQSYKIEQGGSAAVVFKATDESGLKELYVQTNFGKKFEVTHFYKDGYYAALLAWPSQENEFSADVIAIDNASNITKMRIRYYLQNRKYRVSTIALNDNFLNGKILDLTNRYATDPESMDKLAKFKFVNETLRISNEDKIRAVTSKVPEKAIEGFFVKPFYPLRNGAAVASFGDHRFYTYDGLEASQSYHMGLDLASTAGANIVSSNPAIIVFNEENGIYGLNLVLYHGFGLYTLYGHCSGTRLNLGDKIKPGDVIATTGTSGLALGDHLHFGVIVQGIEVRPEEWMDAKWTKDNIYDILESSKKLMDNRR